MLYFIFEILTDAFSVSTTTLHTRKIDRNIERLQQYDWFKDIYHDDQYRRLFFANRHVRKFLESNVRVNRMIKKKQVQERFIYFLSKQLKNHPRSS
ncbi:hypothetical protein [Lysinibacillus cavernae]|uniref:hypothetical protein n=1 Tax=Lysinibacillus cavernae TaxID=2666135 RepID=UPI0012D88984|nr:hypothetical protein [Lysinibacillus cavernae]